MAIRQMHHVSVVVDDIDATVAALTAVGGSLVGEIARYEDI